MILDLIGYYGFVYLCQRSGFRSNLMKILGAFRDWSRTRGYPELTVYTFHGWICEYAILQYVIFE